MRTCGRNRKQQPPRRRLLSIPRAFLTAACILTLLVGCSGAPPSPDSAGVPPGEAKKTAEAWLSRNGWPVATEQWRSLGESGQREVLRIIGDTGQSAVVRARAVSAMVAFPHHDNLKLLESLAHSDESIVVRRSAIFALADAYPSQAPSRLAPLLLDDPDCMIREAVCFALSELRGEAVRDILKEAENREKDPLAQSCLARVLKIQRQSDTPQTP